MSHTMQCYVNDGLDAVTAGWELPIAPWSWGHQDSLYASLGPPGKSPMAGADAPAPNPDGVLAPLRGGPSALRWMVGAAALATGGVLLKFAYDAAQAHRGTRIVPQLPERAPARSRTGWQKEPWYAPEATYAVMRGKIQSAKDKAAEKRERAAAEFESRRALARLEAQMEAIR